MPRHTPNPPCQYCSQPRRTNPFCCLRFKSLYHYVKRHARRGVDEAEATREHEKRWAWRERVGTTIAGGVKPSDGLTELLCQSCQRVRFIGDFELRPRLQIYRRQCRDCVNRRVRQHLQSPEARALRLASFDRYRATGKWPAKLRRQVLRKYGISLEHYDAMWNAQGGRCAICLRHQSETTRRLDVDHDHETGLVRALLCHNCNAALGLFFEDPNLLSAAIDYLRRHKREGVG